MAVNYKHKETMENSSDADTDYKVWSLLGQVAHVALRARQKELHQYGIPLMHATVLYVIHAIGDKATPAEISRWLFREPHSVSALLTRMEKDGLVRKVKDLDRKNLVRVTMTEKGQQVYSQSTNRESIHKIMSSLSEEECEHMMACLETMRNKALEELGVSRKTYFSQPQEIVRKETEREG